LSVISTVTVRGGSPFGNETLEVARLTSKYGGLRSPVTSLDVQEQLSTCACAAPSGAAANTTLQNKAARVIAFPAVKLKIRTGLP